MTLQAGPEETAAVVGIILLIAVAKLQHTEGSASQGRRTQTVRVRERHYYVLDAQGPIMAKRLKRPRDPISKTDPLLRY
jgi:hypothetical protein